MSIKSVEVANFNVVFLEKQDEAPLLKYFDKILIPALKSGIKKENGDTKYLFTDIEIREDIKHGYVLTGNIVKKTIIEIKSDLDVNENLIEKDDKYSAAPFSAFVIYLKNHRMLFVKNQKGSPTIKNFSSTIKYVLSEYVRRYNKKQKNKEDFLPYPVVNIVGIPMRRNIEQALKEVDKINKITLRLYPLNGDQDFAGIYGDVLSDMRKRANARTGNYSLNSPKSVSGVIEIVEKSQGTVIPIINVTYPDKTKGTIKQDLMSEKLEMDFEEDNINDINEVLSKGENINSIAYTSKGNEELYDTYKGKINKLLK